MTRIATPQQNAVLLLLLPLRLEGTPPIACPCVTDCPALGLIVACRECAGQKM